MKYIYYLNTAFTMSESNRFLEFMNNVSLERDEDTTVDIYINSEGGELDTMHLIKDIIENSGIEITLIANNNLHSCAFILFYTCNNVNKRILPSTHTVLHSLSVPFEDRDSKRKDIYFKMSKSLLELDNKYYSGIWKTYGVITDKEIKLLNNGNDITITTDRLITIMNNCPYGRYIS